MITDFDTQLRREAMQWLTVRTHDGTASISSADLLDFEIGGRQFRLMDAQRGIRKPRELSAALSIRTVYTPNGQARPYDDSVGSDGLLRYKWRGDNPDQAENRALRAAMENRLPLIWFFGVGPGLYEPVYPVYLLWEEPDHHQFVIDPDVARGLVSAGSPVEERLRRYILRETRQRLHQPVSRVTVLRAYDTRCAVCSLRHGELLDAAHIIPDYDEAGIAAVRNGMSLCKIHHAAYDCNILGIRPDLFVEIRSDLLHEIDGPMLQHGLQERHGQRLMSIPRTRSEKPDSLLLQRRYEQFRAAS
ncbi:MAG TPA: HNH endonuclease [Pseudonocardiaceae bacterium]|nr:HNH endonuclease [Pseudonocardiaceae bacterium]